MKTKLVIFGITGDLSRRKLLPALRQIVASGEFPDLSMIGVSRREVDVPALIRDSTGDEVLVPFTSMYTMDLAEPSHYDGLNTFIDLKQDEQALVYLSVPPSAAADIVDFMGQAGLNTPNVKLLFEKPFGFDYESAEDFIARTNRYYEEAQIFRIDHYMAKEFAAQVIRMRSQASTQHEWGSASVAGVDIIASETIGIEGRATFYEQTGALRDFIQGHLMQLLSLVLLDLSPPFAVDNLAERRSTALHALQPAQPAEAVRAQYEGYDSEVGNMGSRTETFASVTLWSTDERWRDVPLRLVTGKALDKKRSAIIVRYKDGTEDIIDEAAVPTEERQFPDAYERVLVEAIRNRKYIFTTSVEVLRSWQLLQPVQRAWDIETTPLIIYPKGSSIDDIMKKR